MTDTPRTYRIPGKWGWFFTLSEEDREDVCFGFDPSVRDELERNEWIILNESGPGYYRAVARVKELEELLEPAGEVEAGTDSPVEQRKGTREFDHGARSVVFPSVPASTSSEPSEEVTAEGERYTSSSVTSFAGRVNSSTADETGSLSPESEAVLENHHADTIGGMAA